MGKLKFYALVCRNLKSVMRHNRTIATEDLVIVINTEDTEFQEAAEQYCVDAGIEHYITVSDGGPSKGKNSVLELFEASDNDYMVLVDGDDYITPHGYWTYKELAKNDYPPDVLALEYQYGIYRESGYHPAVSLLSDVARCPTLGVADTDDPDKIHGFGTRVFFQDKPWWEHAVAGTLLPHVKGDTYSNRMSDVHQRWATHCYKYISNWESHLRLVWFSKKATTGNRFDTNFRVGEDTLFYLTLKKQALDGKFIMRHLFDRYPTYVYDTRINGIVQEERDAYGEPGTEDEETLIVDYGWYKWLKTLVEEYDKYEEQGIMSEQELPRITVKTHGAWHAGEEPSKYDIEWPEDYHPDTGGLVNYPSTTKVYF